MHLRMDKNKQKQNKKTSNLRPETVQLQEENIGKHFLDSDLGDDFLAITPKVTNNEMTNRQMGLHQTKNLLLSKVNSQQNEKATYSLVKKYL